MRKTDQEKNHKRYIGVIRFIKEERVSRNRQWLFVPSAAERPRRTAKRRVWDLGPYL